jgi:hypothetical protein
MEVPMQWGGWLRIAGSKTLTCDDGTKVDIKTGAPGKDGAGCTVATDAAGKKVITCADGTKVTVSDGTPGKDGQNVLDGKEGQAGQNGKSCTVKDNGDGTKTLKCEDGAAVTVLDGQAGKDGQSCTAKDNRDGSKTLTCDDGTTATVYDGKAGQPGPSSTSTGIQVEVKSVTTVATDPISVRFLLKDDKGFAVDVCGNYSLNTVIQPRFGLAYVQKDTAGNVLPYVMLTRSASSSAPTIANPTMLNPLGSNCKAAVDTAGVSTGHGTLKENGTGLGDYTYTFPTADTAKGPLKVAYDAS